jgi:hypothetical protein
VTALSRLETLPDWPARMTAPVAAAYMGVSEGTFLARFGAYGKKEGANKLWARAQLDLLIAKQFALSQPRGSAARDDSWDDVR